MMLVTWSTISHVVEFWVLPTEKFEKANIWTWPTIDHEIVEDFKALHRSRREAHNLLVLSTLRPDAGVAIFNGLPTTFLEILHEDLAGCCLLDGFALLCAVLRSDGSVDGAGKPHAKVDTNPSVNGGIHNGFVIAKVEIGEEAQGSQGKWQHWWDNTLEQPRGEEYCAIASKLRGTIQSMNTRIDWQLRTVTTKSKR